MGWGSSTGEILQFSGVIYFSTERLFPCELAWMCGKYIASAVVGVPAGLEEILLKAMAEEPAEPILVKDVGDYSVWDKPPGLRSQGSKWGDHCTVVRWAERHLEPVAQVLTQTLQSRRPSRSTSISTSKNRSRRTETS